MSEASPRSSVALIIPALNEAESIVSVVNSMRQYGHVIVVDDGSRDGTGVLAADAGASVVAHKVNKGYGQALSSGLQHALNRGFEFAITLDADGQHTVQSIEQVLKSLQLGADLVVGIRGRRQRFSESIFSFVTRLLWGVHDPLCGLKGYRLKRLSNLTSLSSYESVGTELVFVAARSGWQIVQVPIAVLRRSGSSRFGSGLRANGKILKALLWGLVKSTTA